MVLILKSLIGKADQRNVPGNFTWDQLNRFMNNIGEEEFDYETFKLTYDANPTLQTLIARFDQNGIELKTKTQSPEQGPIDGDTGSDEVSQMAKRATANAQAA